MSGTLCIHAWKDSIHSDAAAALSSQNRVQSVRLQAWGPLFILPPPCPQWKIVFKIGLKIGTTNTVIFVMTFSNLLLKRVGNTLIG